MRRIYWSLPALLLAGAVVWAQQPGNTPNRTGSASDLPPLPASAPNSGVNFITPAGALSQAIPATIRTVRTDLNGKVTYDSGVLPLGGSSSMMSGGPGNSTDGMMMGGMGSGPMKAKQVQRTVIETQYVPLSEAEANELQSYQAAVATLKSDESADKKELARKQLFELLSVGFDRDLEGREADLKSLETRVQKLRTQLDKRKTAKQEIIDLRLKTIQNEADGLEYPGAGAAPQPLGNPLLPSTEAPTYNPQPAPALDSNQT